jgi:hypothetical protein
MRAATYEDLGGVSGALRDHAEQAWHACAALAGDTQAQRLLTSLVRVLPGAEAPLRRALTRDEAGEDAWRLARALADHPHRLLVLHGGDGRPESAELAHEALIGVWPALTERVRAVLRSGRLFRRCMHSPAVPGRRGRTPGIAPPEAPWPPPRSPRAPGLPGRPRAAPTPTPTAPGPAPPAPTRRLGLPLDGPAGTGRVNRGGCRGGRHGVDEARVAGGGRPRADGRAPARAMRGSTAGERRPAPAVGVLRNALTAWVHRVGAGGPLAGWMS